MLSKSNFAKHASLLLVAACFPIPSAAQVAAPAPAAPAAAAPATLPLETGEGRAVALKLADELVSNFVFRDQAEACAAMLRKNSAAGRYDSGMRGDLAKLLTDDLQAVHKDGHLHVELKGEDRPGASSGPRRDFRR